jgi:adenosylcobinamide kinase/adenosylcobinamide-phosphate guanylyltransferase
MEEPLQVPDAIRNARHDADVFIVDCVTIWLSNMMWEHRALNADALETEVLASIDLLIAAAGGRDVIVVSNDVSVGIVPNDAVARRFRDLQGLANQQIATAADRVIWMVAGLPIPIKTDAVYESPRPAY